MNLVYSVEQEDDTPSVQVARYQEKNWWSLEVFPPTVFESSERDLHVRDQDGAELPSSLAPDCSKVTPGVFAFGERAWPLLAELATDGCRVAEHVTTNDGRAFKLVYPGAVLDILNHEQSQFTLNDSTPETATYSSIRRPVLYETNQRMPLLFRVLLHHPGVYRGVAQSPSVRVFATDGFVEMYRKLGLTGFEFIQRERTRRSGAEPPSVVVYSPMPS